MKVPESIMVCLDHLRRELLEELLVEDGMSQAAAARYLGIPLHLLNAEARRLGVESCDPGAGVPRRRPTTRPSHGKCPVAGCWSDATHRGDHFPWTCKAHRASRRLPIGTIVRHERLGSQW